MIIAIPSHTHQVRQACSQPFRQEVLPRRRRSVGRRSCRGGGCTRLQRIQGEEKSALRTTGRLSRFQTEVQTKLTLPPSFLTRLIVQASVLGPNPMRRPHMGMGRSYLESPKTIKGHLLYKKSLLLLLSGLLGLVNKAITQKPPPPFRHHLKTERGNAGRREAIANE